MNEDLPHVVVTRTFSKSFGLAGLRVGYAIAHPEVIATLDKLRDSYNVNRVAQAAALAALRAGNYFTACCKRIIVSRGNLSTALAQRGFLVHDSKANFIFAPAPACARNL
jgi:histidinol-phosphate aminotransferase